MSFRGVKRRGICFCHRHAGPQQQIPRSTRDDKYDEERRTATADRRFTLDDELFFFGFNGNGGERAAMTIAAKLLDA